MAFCFSMSQENQSIEKQRARASPTIRGDPAVRSSLNRARREHRPGAKRHCLGSGCLVSFVFFWNGFSHPSIHPSIFPDLLRSYLESNSISSPPMKSYPILPIHPAIVIYAHISVVNPITNHPQYHHFYGCYKPSPTSRFIKIGFII